MNYGQDSKKDAGDIVKKPRRSSGERKSSRSPKSEGGKVENA